MRVERYDLFLDVDFEKLRLSGRVLISLESEHNIVLDSSGLEITEAAGNGRRLEFEQIDDKLQVKSGRFKGRLEVKYKGPVQDALAGIYKARYDGTYMITTHFEAANARRMLPCADHPACKAEFKLRVRTERDLDVISNTPIESVLIEGEKKEVTFQITPRMSTYLLYLGIGRFEEISERLGNIDVLVASTPGKSHRGAFALEVAKRSIKFYESYFGIRYMLPKVHLIAVPEFASGAMENWGAITFRQTALHVDENSSISTRKRVAGIVSHEFAHMWFGNLVTMKWWNDLWLNESFATLMSYKLVDETHPNWSKWHDFLIEETAAAMNMDSLMNTHPIEADVQSPSEIEQNFDAITYSKGASILRMIEAYIGPTEFRNGLRLYLKRHELSNATGEDLWDSLDKVSGKQVKRIMNEWLRKPGYPVVTATMERGKLALRQERFLLSGRSEKTTWPIPVNMTIDGRPASFLFNSEEKTIDVDGAKSFQLNPGRTGFYRVQYRGVDSFVSRAALSTPDRWGILSDAMGFLLAGSFSFADYETLIKKYYAEEEYLTARELSDQLAFLHAIVESRIADISREFHRAQLKILRDKRDENSSLLRAIIAKRLVMIDDDYAAKLGSRFHEYESVEPDLREAVAKGYARAHSDLEAIIKRYADGSSDEEKVRLLGAMMSFKETRLISEALAMAQNGQVKRQDILTMLLAARVNREARQPAWAWIVENIAELRRLYGGTGTLSRLFHLVIPILGLGREEVRRFFDQNELPEANWGVNAGLETLKIYERLASRIRSEMQDPASL